MCSMFLETEDCSVGSRALVSVPGRCLQTCCSGSNSNCRDVASMRTPSEYEGHCSVKRFSNTAPSVYCFGLHSCLKRARSISLRLEGKYSVLEKTEAFILVFSNIFFLAANLRKASQTSFTLFLFSVMLKSFDWKCLHYLRFFEKTVF